MKPRNLLDCAASYVDENYRFIPPRRLERAVREDFALPGCCE
jgi:hypothetical protein